MHAQEPLGERVVDVRHQVDEHRVRLLLVFEQGVFLTPRPIVNRIAQLVEVVEMVLPLLIEHVEHHERQQLIPILAERLELGLERVVAGLAAGRFRVGHRRRASAGLLERRHRDEVMHQQILAYEFHVPVHRALVVGERGLNAPRERLLNHLQRLAFQFLSAIECERAQRIDDFALLVHHVVVFEQPLAALEILQFDPLLRLLDGTGDQGMRQHLPLLRPHPVHQPGDAIRPEQAHQVVLEGEEELRGAGVALAARPASQLAVDASRLVPFRSDDMQAAALGDRNLLAVGILHGRRLGDRHTGAEFDVGAAAGHVRGDRHGARLSGERDNLGLALVILRVEHVVDDARPLEHPRQRLRRLDARRAGQHRKAEFVEALRLLDDRVVLLAPGLEDQVVPVLADRGLIGRDDRNVETVNLEELRLLGLGGAGHAGQFLVHPEVVLDGDRSERLRLTLHLHPFLRLDGLMQALAPSPAGHRAAGELIDDQHLPFLHDIVHVLLVQGVRLEQLVHDVELLALKRIFGLDLAARLELGRNVHVGILVDPPDLARNVRQDERFVVGR